MTREGEIYFRQEKPGLAQAGGRHQEEGMKNVIFPVMVCLLLCQCETVSSPSDRRLSLTDSGLSPAERERAARNRALSGDRNDPLSKVHTNNGAVGVSVLEF